MVKHAERSHARWSASATARNWNCAGALALAEQVQIPDKESEAAAWGTAAHEVSEWCFKEGRDAIEFVDRVVKTKEHTITVDEEIAETAQEYVDYVRGRIAAYKDETGDEARLWVERNFKFDSLNPPFQSGGTGDAILYFPNWELIEIVDLKGGRGVVVEVTNNKQARSYALGAMLEFTNLKVRQVMSTIVQPRAPHKDGRIRSETIHVVELMEWAHELLERMNASADAMKAFEKAASNSVAFDEWADTHLASGDHCKFCPAAGICPRLRNDAFEKTGAFFDDLDQPALRNTPDQLGPAALAKVLDAADMIEDFIKAARAYGHSLAENGTEVPGYILVEKVGRRKFIHDGDDLVEKLTELGLERDALFAEPKLKPMGQIEKIAGKGKLDDLIEKPITGTNLVRADKTTRAAVQSKADKFFSALD